MAPTDMDPGNGPIAAGHSKVSSIGSNQPLPGQDPILRLNCLDMASRLGKGSAVDVVHAAQVYINFISCAPAEPPLKPVSNLPAYQQRVIDEKTELDKKMFGLSTFLETRLFEELDPMERERMRNQLDFMEGYSTTLAQRIAAFPKGGA